MRMLTDEEWEAVEARVAKPSLTIAVVTTGIFCRVGCPARTPLRKNIRAYPTPHAAAADGFRPCLKCNPLGEDPAIAPVVAAARAMADAPEEAWDAAQLRQVSGLSAKVLNARFEAAMGCRPKAFRDAVRLSRFKGALRDGATVTDATYTAGYSGPAQRHAATKDLGMTPTEYAAGAPGEIIEYVVAETVLGLMVMAASEKGICVLKFAENERDAAQLVEDEFPKATLRRAAPDALVHAFTQDVVAFLREGGPRPDLPVDLRGTAFQLKVWQALQEIPKGETRTYGALAEAIGHPGAYRAVGNANGKNPVAVLVPCHLVLAAGGKLGGYAYGLEMKKHLLGLEGVGEGRTPD